MNAYTPLAAGLLALGSVACGGSAVPESQMMAARTSVSAAEAVGASNEPKAALHLKLAKDEIAAAEGLIQEGENDRARDALTRARLDADLSLSLTREAETRRLAQEAIDKIDALNRGRTLS